MQIVLAARAYGLDVLDGVYNDFRDRGRTHARMRDGRAMGFDGKTLIHPAQIGPVNEVFGIDAGELAEAKAIAEPLVCPKTTIGALSASTGKMVERLHLEMAERLIEKAARIDRGMTETKRHETLPFSDRTR
jgi:citrate lyase subunit beta/citryl-CoA lyase